MAYLLDTNVLLRRARPADSHYQAARSTIENLVQRGEILYISLRYVRAAKPRTHFYSE